MNIHEIASTTIRGEKALVFPLKVDVRGGAIVDQNGRHILYVLCIGRLQDGIAEWVVATLNAEFIRVTGEV